MLDSAIRLSHQQIEFDYKKDTYMTSLLVISNITSNQIAFKFKATNPNVFLVKPAIGILSPYGQCTINFTLHHKVLEKGLEHFNEKLQLLSTIAANPNADPEQLFVDKSKKLDMQKINVVLLDQGKQVIAQSQISNSMFASVNKQSQFQFGNLEPNKVLTIPSASEARQQGSYFSTKFDQIQSEVLQKEQQLETVKSDLQQMAARSVDKGAKINKIIFLLLLLLSFYISYYYSDTIVRHAQIYVN